MRNILLGSVRLGDTFRPDVHDKLDQWSATVDSMVAKLFREDLGAATWVAGSTESSAAPALCCSGCYGNHIASISVIITQGHQGGDCALVSCSTPLEA
jgi:hypothetical protein